MTLCAPFQRNPFCDSVQGQEVGLDDPCGSIPTQDIVYFSEFLAVLLTWVTILPMCPSKVTVPSACPWSAGFLSP